MTTSLLVVLSVAHNHLPHHILTAYSLGASPKHLQATFEANVKAMAPLPVPTVDSGITNGDTKGATENDEEKKPLKELVIDQNNWHDTTLLGVKESVPTVDLLTRILG